MRSHLRKLTAALACLALLSSLCAMATPAPTHAAVWNRSVYLDGQEAYFSTAEGTRAWLYQCGGDLYMPAGTAAAWLGCTLSVDRAAKAASLTSGVQAAVPGPNSTTRSMTDAELEVFDRRFDEGVDVFVLTDFTVYVDGAPWTGADGAALPVFFVDSTLYLPIDSVGARMGKNVLRLEPPDTELYYLDPCISIDTPVTQAQLAEMQTYLDQCLGLYWQASAVCSGLLAAGDLSGGEAAAKLGEAKRLLQQIDSLPSPSCHFLDKHEIHSPGTPFPYMGLDDTVERLNTGTVTFRALKESGQLSRELSSLLLNRYRPLNDAAYGLNALAAGMNAA